MITTGPALARGFEEGNDVGSLMFVVKRGREYLLPGDNEEWTADWFVARQFTQEQEQEVNAVAERLSARVVAID